MVISENIESTAASDNDKQTELEETGVGIKNAPDEKNENGASLQNAVPQESESTVENAPDTGMPVSGESIESEKQEIHEEVKTHPDARWYVVHTLSGQEMKVRRYIENTLAEKEFAELILKVFVPMEDVVEMRQGKRKTIQKKFFPGYILIHMVAKKETLAFIRAIPGITGFITAGDKPISLEDGELEAIVQRTEKKKTVQKMEMPFMEGDHVRVIDGPFKDFAGVVSEVHRERGKVRVMVSIFGRLTPVDVDVLQLKEDKK